MNRDIEKLFANRKLFQGYPEIQKLSVEWFSTRIDARPDEKLRIEKLLHYIDRLIDLKTVQNVLVLGCGPRPHLIRILMELGYNVAGIEPQPLYVLSAQEMIGATENIKIGSAEDIPVADGSQHLVLFESVLEHVDSPLKSLNEIYRVLAPGSIVIISTTNRYKLSLTGHNGEFNVRYFNWLPDLVKECFVFHHLHFDPALANYTPRPAVHWFSFADLCKLGRMAGFAQFYSILDLVNVDDPSIAKSKFRSFLLNKLKYNPWLRAFALTQLGGTIIMLKRME